MFCRITVVLCFFHELNEKDLDWFCVLIRLSVNRHDFGVPNLGVITVSLVHRKKSFGFLCEYDYKYMFLSERPSKFSKQFFRHVYVTIIKFVRDYLLLPRLWKVYTYVFFITCSMKKLSGKFVCL